MVSTAWWCTVLVVMLVPAARVGAQGQPAYTSTQFACARLREVLETSLTLETSGRMGSANSGREGDLLMASSPALTDHRIPIVAWYDSLRIWRVAGGTRVEPDASGLLGGQYRGDLLPDGVFITRDRPFVPDEIREAMDMANALDGFLPRLPPRLLQVAEEWRSGDTLSVQRLADSASLQRYRIRIERHGSVPPTPGDTLTPAYTRDLTDVGIVAWDEVRGPVRYDHRIDVVATVPAGGAVRRAVRSQMQQHAVFERRDDPPEQQCRSVVQ